MLRKQRLNLEAVERYQKKHPRPLKGSGAGYINDETIEEQKIRLNFIDGESFEDRQRRLNSLAVDRYKENKPDNIKETQSAYLASSSGQETRKRYRELNKDYLNDVKDNWIKENPGKNKEYKANAKKRKTDQNNLES